MEVDENTKIREVLRMLGYNAPSVVVLKKGLPVPEDEVVENNEEYSVVVVYSGG